MYLDKYISRLAKEWATHSKIIVGVDYDSTISPYHTIDNLSDIDRCVKLLKEVKHTGAYIVLHTCCDKNRYGEIKQYCSTALGFVPDAINENPFELPFGNNTKPYCNIYLDDRAGFIESMTILESAMYIIRGERATISTLNQTF